MKNTFIKAKVTGCNELTIFENPFDEFSKELCKIKRDAVVDVNTNDTVYTHMHNIECVFVKTSEGVSGYAVTKGLQIV